MQISEQTWLFIEQHKDDDVRQLALKGCKDAEVDLRFALEQVAGRQTAIRKLPSWAKAERLVFPPHLAMEQCSSELTARYKASIVERVVERRGSMADLTGGFGVDFSFLARCFRHAVYVERQTDLCEIAKCNFAQMGLDHAEIANQDCTQWIESMPTADFAFIDPARRKQHGARAYAIEDCTPNLKEIVPLLLQRTRHVLAKLSPMLDWHEVANSINGVSEIHIVSADNECKELLVLFDAMHDTGKEPRIYCVNNAQTLTYLPSEENALPLLGSNTSINKEKPSFIYEPDSSVMKAGCFRLLQQRFGVEQVAPNSHLFISDEYIEDFPGRRFQVDAVSSLNKKEFRKHLNGITKANITTRNFPLSVSQLRQRLKLSDGGPVYIFATTMADKSHALIIAH